MWHIIPCCCGNRDATVLGLLFHKEDSFRYALEWREGKIDDTARCHGARQRFGIDGKRWLFIHPYDVARCGLEGFAALIVTLELEDRHAAARMTNAARINGIRHAAFRPALQQIGIWHHACSRRRGWAEQLHLDRIAHQPTALATY